MLPESQIRRSALRPFEYFTDEPFRTTLVPDVLVRQIME